MLEPRGDHARCLETGCTDRPRSYQWCIREALGQDTTLNYLEHAPHSFSPAKWIDNLRTVGSARHLLFCVGPNLLVPASKCLGVLHGRLVVLVWSLPQHNWVREKLVQSQLSAADRLVVNDTGTGRQLGERWPDLAEKVTFVPYPVDSRFFVPGQDSRQDYVLVPGDMDRDNEFVCNLAEELSCPVVRVTREPRVRQFYERRGYDRKRLTVLFRVSFHELRTLYQQARAVVLPVMNHRHPAGLTSLLEAMACGCACLVASGKTTTDYVQDGKSAIFLSGTRQEMVGQVLAALDSGRLNELGAEARRRVEELFSVDVLVPQWRRLFEF
jgi:glycosyltransferase involved in cell wall biosynthesis